MSNSSKDPGPPSASPPMDDADPSEATPGEEGDEFGPANASTEALGEIASGSAPTDVRTGGPELPFPAGADSGPEEGAENERAPVIDPYTNAKSPTGRTNPFVGKDVYPFTAPADPNRDVSAGDARAGAPNVGTSPGMRSGGAYPVERDTGVGEMTPRQLQEFLNRQAEIDAHLSADQAPEAHGPLPGAQGSAALTVPPASSALPATLGSPIPPTQPATPAAGTQRQAPATVSPGAGAASSNRIDDRNPRIPVQAANTATWVNQAAAHIYAPRDAVGNKLPSPINLYTDDPALGSGVVRAMARSAPGHLISDTQYYGPADLAERVELARRGLPSGARLPTDVYNNIWGRDASAPAVRDAALGGSVATHNDLKTLRSDSIQKIYELPALKWYGGGMGALGMAGGAALIYGGTQQKDPVLKVLGITAGIAEAVGGAARVVGSFKVIAPLQQAGRSLGTAGAILTAPLTAYSFYNKLSKGEWFDAIVDGSSLASAGLTLGGAAVGSSAALTESGLVLGSFGAGVLVGTVFDKGAEWATKGVLGIDLSPSGLLAAQLTSIDQALTMFWSDPTQPAYTQSAAWKFLQWAE